MTNINAQQPRSPIRYPGSFCSSPWQLPAVHIKLQGPRKFHTAQAAHPHAHARVARTLARTPGSLSIGLVAWGLRILTSGPSRAFALPGGTGCLWRGSRHGLTTWSTHESFSCHVAKITWPRSRGHGSHRHHRTVAALPRSTARLQSQPVRRQVGAVSYTHLRAHET